MKVSICIPYHDTPKTAFFLSRLLKSINDQTFTNYEIILTKEGKMAENTNAAMRKAKGELVKIMYMDDYFTSQKSLQWIVDGFSEDDMWQAVGCFHDNGDGTLYGGHTPEYTLDIITGNNKIGSPSVITLRREGMLFFDESLSFLLDCDLYQRYYEKHGPPKILTSSDIVIGIHPNQVSQTMPSEEKLQEFNYLKEKYGK
jgi:hypothetical protein